MFWIARKIRETDPRKNKELSDYNENCCIISALRRWLLGQPNLSCRLTITEKTDTDPWKFKKKIPHHWLNEMDTNENKRISRRKPLYNALNILKSDIYGSQKYWKNKWIGERHGSVYRAYSFFTTVQTNKLSKVT